MRMPDFICVGAQKAGTTWFYEQISRHPQVFMRTKEIDFFFKPLDLSWYSKFFAEAPEMQLCGDISPNYAAFIGLSGRIKHFCPAALIIHLLRNPVDRYLLTLLIGAAIAVAAILTAHSPGSTRAM